MAVITRYIVIRDGVELDQVFTEKKEAEAFDKMLDAAQQLAALINQADLKLDIDSKTIDAISVHLAKNAPTVTSILKSVKPIKPASKEAEKEMPGEANPETQVKKKGRRPNPKDQSKANS